MKIEVDLSNIHPQVREHFPDFDYHTPAHPELLDMRRPDNITGHWQRTFSVYWALKQCLSTGKVGLDIGSGGCITPYTIGMDRYVGEHPFYGGTCRPTMRCCGEDLSVFSSDIFPLVLSNHSIEHMEVTGDAGVVCMLREHWLRVLEPGGILAMIVPDNAHCDVLAIDKSHFHAWTANEFRHNIVGHLCDLVAVLEYNAFCTYHSFECVLQKR